MWIMARCVNGANPSFFCTSRTILKNPYPFCSQALRACSQTLSCHRLLCTARCFELATMASSSSWEIVLHSACHGHITRDAYRYENLTIGLNAMVYVCEGQISYHCFGQHTAYHGSFQVGPDQQSVCLTFDCRGNTDQLKSTILLETGADRQWTGWDHAGRFVRLTHVGLARFCARCEVWHDEFVTGS